MQNNASCHEVTFWVAYRWLLIGDRFRRSGGWRPVMLVLAADILKDWMWSGLAAGDWERAGLAGSWASQGGSLASDKPISGCLAQSAAQSRLQSAREAAGRVGRLGGPPGRATVSWGGWDGCLRARVRWAAGPGGGWWGPGSCPSHQPVPGAALLRHRARCHE